MRLYHHVREASFLRRPNRFIAHCLLEGESVVCHVKNTGRCRELLLPGARVWLAEADNPDRKTRFDLVCVEKDGRLINMDSQAPNRVFAEWAQGGGLGDIADLRPEVPFGASRFDFAYRRGDVTGYVEIKGVTLFDNHHVAYFPDAPTERGVKHVRELIAARRAGCEATLCFILQREGVRCLKPNDATHPAFGDALEAAAASGVRLMAAVCHVTPDSMAVTGAAPVILTDRRASP